MLAKQMVSAPEVTGAAVHSAACIFGTRRALVQRIRTLITLCVRRCITRVTLLHSRVFYTTEYVVQDMEVRCGMYEYSFKKKKKKRETIVCEILIYEISELFIIRYAFLFLF